MADQVNDVPDAEFNDPYTDCPFCGEHMFLKIEYLELWCFNLDLGVKERVNDKAITICACDACKYSEQTEKVLPENEKIVKLTDQEVAEARRDIEALFEKQADDAEQDECEENG